MDYYHNSCVYLIARRSLRRELAGSDLFIDRKQKRSPRLPRTVEQRTRIQTQQDGRSYGDGPVAQLSPSRCHESKAEGRIEKADGGCCAEEKASRFPWAWLQNKRIEGTREHGDVLGNVNV